MVSPFQSQLHGLDDDKQVFLAIPLISCRAKWADTWFETLESVVHSEVNRNRKDGKLVRIAILDTGVDATHPDVRDAFDRKQILGFFPDSSGSESVLDPHNDEDGHGTHGTSVLIRVAPAATIYVARVTDQEGKLNYDRIVEVLVYFILC
jgi:hypothetical protein